MENLPTVERKSGSELVTTRTFNAPARIVFESWTTPELFVRWWAPKSMRMSLLSCDKDVRWRALPRYMRQRDRQL